MQNKVILLILLKKRRNIVYVIQAILNKIHKYLFNLYIKAGSIDSKL